MNPVLEQLADHVRKVFAKPAKPSDELEKLARWQVIEVPIWKARVFIVCCEYDVLLRLLRERTNVDADHVDRIVKEAGVLDEKGTRAVTITCGCADSIVWSRKPVSGSELVHELAHVAFNILANRDCEMVGGAKIKSEEPFTYLIEYLFEEATK